MSEIKTALMICQTIFNFQFNEHDIKKIQREQKTSFLFFLTTSDIINEFVYRQFHSLRFHLIISFSIPFNLFFKIFKKSGRVRPVF